METGEPSAATREATNPQNPPPNPPSIETAYKQKCIELKKRLQEVEDHNEAMRMRNERGRRYVQKMRLESCILLERLNVLAGMKNENETDPGARASEVMPEGSSSRTIAAKDPLDDESMGSEEDKPPTPDERPVRSKRSRKTDEHIKNVSGEDHNADSAI